MPWGAGEGSKPDHPACGQWNGSDSTPAGGGCKHTRCRLDGGGGGAEKGSCVIIKRVKMVGAAETTVSSWGAVETRELPSVESSG